MAFSNAGGGASKAEINVTPLIDVLLTLIIVFMVVVSMDKESGEQAQIPQPDQKQTAANQQSSTIVIQLLWNKDGTAAVKINREDVRWPDLETRLAQIYLTRAVKVAFVRGDDDVEFQYVADAIDVAHHAGVLRVGLLGKGREMEGE
jgi:biopolymer transport protein ExbD